jgi:hypothetical protein
MDTLKGKELIDGSIENNGDLEDSLKPEESQKTLDRLLFGEENT